MSGRARGRGKEPADGYSFRRLVLTVTLLLWSGCSLQQPLQSHIVGGFGRIEFRKSQSQSSGVVVGVPHGISEPAAVSYAKSIAGATGAGIVIAYGFRARRVAVTQPLVRAVALQTLHDNEARRITVFPEFKSLLGDAANGPLKFYFGLRIADENSKQRGIEIATTGFSFEQARVLKEVFGKIRDRELEAGQIAKLSIVLDPIDRLSWNIDGFKHHGVLMLAEKGLNLRLPANLSSGLARSTYERIFIQWMRVAMAMAKTDFAMLPQLRIAQLPYGRIELIPARRNTGTVVAAPHGTFDAHTGAMVRRICSRMGLAGVIATGFTPTEIGSGRRINVNRPTERRVNASEREVQTERAEATYDTFRKLVFNAAQGELKLYFDIHQNSGQRIEVATVGLSGDEARMVKSVYRELRDAALVDRPDIEIVDLAIEPLDQIEVGAWAAKSNGILRLAKKSLHFELPGHGVMTDSHRQAYTVILGELLGKVAAQFADGS